MLSVIIPSRNNLEYLKLAVESLYKNDFEDWELILIADNCDDGTDEYIKNFDRYYIHHDANRLGITGAYNLGASMAKGEYLIFFHADMIASKGFLKNMFNAYSILPGEHKIVCATRVEPPLHPSGKEKIVVNSVFGKPAPIYPEGVSVDVMQDFLKSLETDKVTNGAFAPIMISKDDFNSVDGYDRYFYPQSREDSDLFLRLLKRHNEDFHFYQTWRALCYHFTCRGSRFNESVGGDALNRENSNEWVTTNHINTLNFIRRWGYRPKTGPELEPLYFRTRSIDVYFQDGSIWDLTLIEPYARKIYYPENMQPVVDEFKKQFEDTHQFSLDVSEVRYVLDEKFVLYDRNKRYGTFVIIYDNENDNSHYLYKFLDDLEYVRIHVKESNSDEPIKDNIIQWNY